MASAFSPNALLARQETAQLFNRGLRLVLGIAFVFGCLAALLIGLVILQGTMPMLGQIELSRFFTDSDWYPTSGLYDLKPMLFGSLATSLGAFLVATPISLVIAAAMNLFIGPFAATLLRRLLFVMAAMPTVIFGFWGLTQVVPLIATLQAPGLSLLSGILVLSMMIIPTTTLLMDAAFSKLPKQLINGCFALGATRRLTCFGMAVHVLKSAILSSALLGLGRALGETIVVVMVTGNKAELPLSLFDPVRTLTANVALEIGYADPLHSATLFFSILILFLLATGLALAVNALDKTTQVQVDV
ncbi:MAG: ABC transporter permease subunit [Pseudomonadota bacterium]